MSVFSYSNDVIQEWHRTKLFQVSISALLFFCLEVNAITDLTIVTTEEAPYQFYEGEELVGESAGIVKQLLQYSGYQNTKITSYPWARAFNTAITKTNTAIFSIARTPKREKHFHWVCPLVKTEYIVLKLKGRNEISISELEDMNNYTTGVWLDDLRHHYLEEKGIHNLDVVTNDLFNIKKLLSKRVDLYVAEKRTFKYQIENKWKHEDIDVSRLEQVFRIPSMNTTLYFAFGINTSEDLIRTFEAACQKLIRE